MDLSLDNTDCHLVMVMDTASQSEVRMPFDDDDAPAETEEAPKEKPAPSRGDSADTCPNGYEFGKDCDRGQLCGKCPDALWAKCDACRSRLKK